jgi:hypothetical protein
MVHPSKERRSTRLERRALYSIAELARVGNVPAWQLRRILQRHGVALLRSGRLYYVTLGEVQRKIPPLWESICLVAELRNTRRPRPRATPAASTKSTTRNP